MVVGGWGAGEKAEKCSYLWKNLGYAPDQNADDRLIRYSGWDPVTSYSLSVLFMK